jgi:hypothetical protein
MPQAVNVSKPVKGILGTKLFASTHILIKDLRAGENRSRRGGAVNKLSRADF